MEQKYKDILYREMSARLPYSLILDNDGHKCYLEGISNNNVDVRLTIMENGKVRTNCVMENFKPCLYRLCDLPKADILSASQRRIEHIARMKLKHADLENIHCIEFDIKNNNGETVPCRIHEFYGDYEYYVWLYENHIDFCGLIDMGLALEAQDGLYNNITIKQK